MSSLDHFSQLLPISCSLWGCVFIFYVLAFVCICMCKYRLCKYIWWIQRCLCLCVCVCALYYIHVNLYVCLRVCSCLCQYQSWLPVFCCLTTVVVSFDCIDLVLLHAVMKDKKWTACSWVWGNWSAPSFIMVLRRRRARWREENGGVWGLWNSCSAACVYECVCDLCKSHCAVFLGC